MDRKTEYEALLQQFPNRIIRNEPLSTHTTFRIGGPADLFCTVRSADKLIQLLCAVRETTVPVVIIGSGSNILADDRGFHGLVIRFFNQNPPELNAPYITVSAGSLLQDVIKFAVNNSLSGLEFLTGIPGSVGGAVYMNAGAYGKSISDILHQAVIIDSDLQVQTVSSEYFQFGYRSSILQTTRFPVVSAVFRVTQGDAETIRTECSRISSIRWEKIPDETIPSAGSFFKNLPPEHPGENRRPAGFFLDKAGAKQMRFGGAAVYEKHANIIINTGTATASDVLQLARKMKTAVMKMFGISLEEEVRFLDAERGFTTIPADTSAAASL